MRYQGQLLGRLLLRFDADSAHVPHDLSAATAGTGGALWVAADEGGFLERLGPEDPRVYGNHRRFHVGGPLGLGGPDVEIDVEALDRDDDGLWFVGSHSARRKKPRGSEAKGMRRLAEIDVEPSRFVLARIPFERDGLASTWGARQLRPTDGGNVLLDMLREDPHLGPFLAGPAPIPSKDNGLDVEGLAVLGDRVFLGLRGPVLRGWAVLLELSLASDGDALVPQPLGKQLYRKHFLDLDGLGIRELARRGDDLLVLGGPTMNLDGPARLFALRDVARLDGDSLIAQEKGRLEPLFDLPHGEEAEHPEGVALHSWFEEHDSVLVLYDTPHETRLLGPCGVFADVYRVP
jgi:hypothetical protein